MRSKKCAVLMKSQEGDQNCDLHYAASLFLLSKRKTQPSASVVRKYRKLRRIGGLGQQYRKLRSLLPPRRSNARLKHKVGVVDAAYRYICDLQNALVNKFVVKGVPQNLKNIVGEEVRSAADIQSLAIHFIRTSRKCRQDVC